MTTQTGDAEARRSAHMLLESNGFGCAFPWEQLLERDDLHDGLRTNIETALAHQRPFLAQQALTRLTVQIMSG